MKGQKFNYMSEYRYLFYDQNDPRVQNIRMMGDIYIKQYGNLYCLIGYQENDMTWYCTQKEAKALEQYLNTQIEKWLLDGGITRFQPFSYAVRNNLLDKDADIVPFLFGLGSSAVNVNLGRYLGAFVTESFVMGSPKVLDLMMRKYLGYDCYILSVDSSHILLASKELYTSADMKEILALRAERKVKSAFEGIYQLDPKLRTLEVVFETEIEKEGEWER